MKTPSYARFDIYLSRVFDNKTFQSIVYIEEVVRLKPKGYSTIIVTHDSLFVMSMKETKQPTGFNFMNIDDIVFLDDPATFMPEEYQAWSSHMRLYMDDQTPGERVVDIYSIYEDSRLFFYVSQCWMNARMQKCFPVFYPEEEAVSISTLSTNGAQNYFSDVQKRMLKTNNIDDKRKLVEELTMAACDSDQVRWCVLKSVSFLSVIIEEIRDRTDLHVYMSIGHDDLIIDAISQSPEDNATSAIALKYRYLNTCIGFLVRILCGAPMSKLVKGAEKLEDALTLLFPNDPIAFQFFIKAVMLSDMNSESLDSVAGCATDYLEMVERKRCLTSIRERKGAIKERIQRREEEAKNQEIYQTLLTKAQGIASRRGLPVDMVMQTLQRRHQRSSEKSERKATKVLKQELLTFDFLQIELIYHLTVMFEYAHLNQSTCNVDMMFDELISDDKFISERIPHLITRLGIIVDSDPVKTPYIGYYIFIVSTVILKMMERSAEVREWILRSNREELILRLNIRNVRKLQSSEPQFFWYDMAYDVLVNILKQLNLKHK